jgi:hypothetical protein
MRDKALLSCFALPTANHAKESSFIELPLANR